MSGCADSTLKLWDINTEEEIRTFFESDAVSSVRYADKGNMYYREAVG